jgi:hypothetical protein
MTLEEIALLLPTDHRARICFDNLKFFCQQIFNGLDTKMLTIDTPADETLQIALRRGRRALERLKS